MSRKAIYSYRGIDGAKVAVVGNARTSIPYLRIEDRAGLYVDSIESPRKLRALAEAILAALDGAR